SADPSASLPTPARENALGTPGSAPLGMTSVVGLGMSSKCFLTLFVCKNEHYTRPNKRTPQHPGAMSSRAQRSPELVEGRSGAEGSAPRLGLYCVPTLYNEGGRSPLPDRPSALLGTLGLFSWRGPELVEGLGALSLPNGRPKGYTLRNNRTRGAVGKSGC